MSDSYVTVLIEPNTLCREGLAKILASSRFDPAERLSGMEQLDRLRLGTRGPVFFIADLGRDPDTAAEHARRLKGQFAGCRLLVMAEQHDPRHMWAVLRAGADGYVMKSTSPEALISSLDLVALGAPVVPQAVLETLSRGGTQPPAQTYERAPIARPLSGRETGILNHLARGESNKMIARKLDITEATVKVHIKAILRKIQVKNRTQAAIWALDQGIGTAKAEPVTIAAGSSGKHHGSGGGIVRALPHLKSA